MFGLSIVDLIIIFVYLLIILLIAFRAMNRIRNSEDYFLGGRKFNKLVQIFSAFGQATSADTGPSVSTTTMKNGAAGIWSALMMLFVTPAYWFTSVWYRRLRVLTMGDYFAERFNSKLMGGVYSVFGSISMTILLTAGYISITKTVMVMTPKDKADFTQEEKMEYQNATRLDELEALDFASLTPSEKQEMQHLRAQQPRKNFSHIDKNIFIWIIAVVVIIYAIIGGLEAAFYSDVLQGFFILILSVLLLPFALNRINLTYGSEGVIGAFRTIHEQLPQSFFEIFGSPYTMDFTWYYIFAISLIAMFNVMVGPNQLVATGSAKNEYTARYGFTFGTYLKRFAIVLWGITALAITLLFAGTIEDPDLLFGYAAYHLLGSLNIGLIGLMIASLVAALMSTADMMMLTTAGLLTHNVYKPFVKNRSEKHYVTAGRLLGALVVIGSALMVMNMDSILNALKANWEFNVIIAAGFWMGILWRRTNRKAVWTSIIATFIMFYLIPILLPLVSPSLRYNEKYLQRTEEQIIKRVYTAHQMDVEQCEHDIRKWEEANRNGLAIGKKPKPIKAGEKFTKKYQQPQRSVFWTQDVGFDEDGRMYGKGNLKMSLVFYNALGFDLTKNKHALNETIKVLTKLVFPFLIVIIISLLTRHSSGEEIILNDFYAKMRTPVTGDKEKDERELQLSMENPKRFDYKLMFPKTQWQICKWNKVDTNGFLVALGMVAAILGLLYFAVNLGG